MIAVGKTGGELTTYSDRFSYSGMTGAWGTTAKAALDKLDTTSGPTTQDTTTDAAGAADPAQGDYGVTYTMQTGAIRYAPMQPVPPKKVTATNTKPLYPKSDVRIATTFLPIPSIEKTITQSQTNSVKSVENTVSCTSSSGMSRC